jgi:hypothetical protein
MCESTTSRPSYTSELPLRASKVLRCTSRFPAHSSSEHAWATTEPCSVSSIALQSIPSSSLSTPTRRIPPTSCTPRASTAISTFESTAGSAKSSSSSSAVIGGVTRTMLAAGTPRERSACTVV